MYLCIYIFETLIMQLMLKFVFSFLSVTSLYHKGSVLIQDESRSNEFYFLHCILVLPQIIHNIYTCNPFFSFLCFSMNISFHNKVLEHDIVFPLLYHTVAWITECHVSHWFYTLPLSLVHCKPISV